MAIDKLPGTAIATGAIGADQIATGGITVADIPAGEITADRLHTTLNLSSKTLTLPAASVTAHAAAALNDLTDVNTSGASNGQVIAYNGSSWVVGNGGPADTDALTEGSSNLYFTNARARSAISENSTQLAYNSSTGVLTFTQGDTDTVTEGSSNLYYTNTRTDARVNLQTGANLDLSSKSTTNLTEGTNLYHTTARVQGTALSTGSLRGTVNNATVQYGSSYTGTPAQGSFFFDSLNAKLKVYDGSAFLDAVPAGGGGGGGGSTDANTTFRKYLYTIGSVGNAVSGKDDVIVTAGAFVTGFVYIIVSAGNTDFTAIGSANNNVGTQFTATGAGSGTGTASHKLNYVTDGTENVEVYVNGIKQIQGSSNDYVATSGTTVNFVSNLAVNDEVEINVFELLTNSSNFASLTVDTSTLVVNGTTNRVGIGTATPFTRAVVGGGSGTEVLTIFSGSSGEGQIRFADATSGTGSYQGRVEYDHVNGQLNLGAGGTTPFTIDSNSNVGIGTASPASRLHIKASNGGYTGGIQIEDNGSSTKSAITHVDGGLYISSNATNDHISILANGNVGIGTNNPDNYYAKDLVIGAADEGGITIVNGTTEQGYLMFADGTSGAQTYRGYIGYDHNIDHLQVTSGGIVKFLVNNNAEAMSITTSGVIQGANNSEILTSPIRKHSNTISTNTTIATTENAIAGGPINVATGVTLTINGNFTVV